MEPSTINDVNGATSEDNAIATNPESTVADSGGKAEGGQTKGILDADWFVSQIGEYARTGTVDVDADQGFYLDTMDKYYSDPLVRQTMIEELGNDDPIMFESYFKAMRKSYLDSTAEAFNKARGTAAEPLDFTTSKGVDRADLLMSSSLDQMMYDDYRMEAGAEYWESDLSHREGKTDRVVTNDGTVVYSDDYDSYSDMLEDDRFISEKGEAPIAFRYVGEQMYTDSKGGALVPVYSDYDNKNLIASRHDITDLTKIYRESHAWHSFAKAPINFLISAIDNSIIETAKSVGYIVYGEDAHNHATYNTLNNWSNILSSTKMTSSDAAASMASGEGLVNLVMDVVMQIGTMKGIGVATGGYLGKLGIPKGKSQQYGAYLARAWMTTFAAGDIGAQGRALGLTKRESAFASFMGIAALWKVNSVFNWVENSIIEHKFLTKGLIAENKKLLERIAIGSRTPAAISKAADSWAGSVKAFVKKASDRVVATANRGDKWGQLLGASLSETGQESAEFMAEEIVKSGSNLYRYYAGDYESTNDSSFKGYNWIMDDNYISDYFLPTLGMSAIGGALGGPIGKFMMGFDPTIGGKNSKVNDMMTYSVLTGNEQAFYEARDYLKKNMAFGDPALSIIKGDDGKFLTMQEAKEVDDNPIDQNTYNLTIIEDAFDFKLKTLSALGLRGVGVNDYNSIMEKSPEVAKVITEYEVGNQLKLNYDIIEKILDRGVSLNSIMTVKESVAIINEEYYKALDESDKEEKTEEAQEEADTEREVAQEDAAKEMVITENGNITLEEAKEVVQAAQNLYNILNGKHAEEMFIKTIYQHDKTKPASKRRFTALDGHVSLESLDGIFQELRVMSETRERNKSIHTKKYNDLKYNDEIINGTGTFSEKVNALKIGDKYIYVSDEAIKKLYSEFNGLDVLKEGILSQVDSLTTEQYAIISAGFNYLLNIDQNTKAGQEILRQQFIATPNAVTKEEVNGVSVYKFDPEAILEAQKDILRKNIKKAKDSNGLYALNMNSISIGDHPSPVKIATNDTLNEHIYTQGTLKARVVDGEGFDAHELLQSRQYRFVGSWDSTDLEHMSADYAIDSEGDIAYEEDSDFYSLGESLIVEAQGDYTEDTNTTVFRKFQEMENLDQRISRRVALFDFMTTIDPLLGGFRQDLTKGNLITFKHKRKFDEDITRFNRVFERTMYNPARKLKLESLSNRSEEQEAEYQKLLTMSNSYSKTTPDQMEKFDANIKKQIELREEIQKAEEAKHPDEAKIEELRTDQKLLITEYSALKSASVLGGLKNLQARLQDELRHKGNVISSDLAKKFKFKSFVEGFRKKTIKEVEMIVEVMNSTDNISIKDLVDNNKSIANLFKLPILNASADTDGNVEDALNTIVKAKTTIHELYRDKLQLISDKLVDNLNSTKPTVRKEASMALLHTIAYSYSDYVAGYKSFVNLDKKDDQEALFDYPANHQQLVAGFEATAYLISDELNDALYSFTNKFFKKHEEGEWDRYKPQNMYAILGRLGSGKTKLVGVMALKIAQDTLGRKNGRILVAAAVDEQVSTLSDVVKKANMSVYDETYLIGADTQGKGLVSFIDSNRNETLPGVDTIFVDEATYLSDAAFISEASKEVKELPEDISKLHRALAQINKNRADAKLPRLKVLLMGDQNQNGAVSVTVEGNVPTTVSVLDNRYLAHTQYINEAERSNIQTLNYSVDRIIEQAMQGKIDVAQERHLKTEFGYDSSTGDILGVPVLDSVNHLASEMLEGADKSIMDILIAKMKADKKYKVGIATDTFANVSEMATKVTSLAPLLNDPEFEGRIKLYSHNNIQGREFDFTIVHADLAGFGADFGTDFPTTKINGRKLSTSVGRSRFGSVIINETDFRMTHKYIPKQTRPSNKLVKSETESLRNFQANSFKDIQPKILTKIDPQKKPTPKPEAKPSPKIKEEPVFSADVMIEEFKTGKGFTIPSNYDPTKVAHRKYILQKAIYHITGEEVPFKTSEKAMIAAYVKALNGGSIDTRRTASQVSNDLKSNELEDVKLTHSSLYHAYAHLAKLTESDYGYSDVYFGDSLVINKGNYGIGMSIGVTVQDGILPLPFIVAHRINNTQEEEAVYIYTGERGTLSVENPLGLSVIDNIILNINEDETKDVLLYLIPGKEKKDVDIYNEVIDEVEMDQIDERLRRQLNNILKTHPKWKSSYTSKDAQIEVLEDIITLGTKDPDTTEQQIQAAMAYLSEAYSIEAHVEDIDTKEFIKSLNKSRMDAPKGAKANVDYMKELDASGIVSLYTSSFNAFAPGVKPGVPSLIHTAKVLADDGMTVAPNSKNYLDITRAIMSGKKGKVTGFVTYAYESPDPGNPYTAMMVAAKYDGKMYVLGHFNNTQDPGENLAKVQQAAIQAIKDGEPIIGRWNVIDFYSMFNKGKSFTPGGVQTSETRMTLQEITDHLESQGLKVMNDIKIITNGPHVGRAMLVYSSNPNDKFENIGLSADPNLGLLDSTRGAVLLDPGYLSLLELTNRLRPMALGDPSYPAPIVKSLSTNNLNLNMSSAMASLVLEWADTYDSTMLSEQMKSDLRDLIAQANVNVWDKNELKKVVTNSVGDTSENGVETINQAAMYALMYMMNSRNWGGYRTYPDGTPYIHDSVGTKEDVAQLKYARNNPVMFAKGPGPGYPQGKVEFNFVGFMRGVKSAVNRMALSVKVGGDMIRGVELETAIMESIGNMLANTKAFKHGIRLSPVVTKGRIPGRGYGVGNLTVLNMNMGLPIELSAPMRGVAAPLLHMRATGNKYNIWDKHTHTTTVVPPTVSPESKRSKTVTIEGFTFDTDILTQDFNRGIKDSGIEDLFNGVESEIDRESMYDRVSDIISEFPSSLNGPAAVYLDELMDRVDNGEFVGKTTTSKVEDDTKVDVNNITENKEYKNASPEQQVEINESAKAVLFFEEAAALTFTEETVNAGITAMEGAQADLAAMDIPVKIKEALTVKLSVLQDSYKLIDVITDPVKLNEKVKEVMNLTLTFDMGFIEPSEDQSLSGLLYSYLTVPSDADDFATQRAAIRGMIDDKLAPSEEVLFDYPFLESVDVEEALQTMAARGDADYTQILAAYNAQRKAFIEELGKEVKFPNSSRNETVRATANIIRDLRKVKNVDKAIDTLASGTIGSNLFTIVPDTDLATFGEANAVNLVMDKSIIGQATAALEFMATEGYLPGVDSNEFMRAVNARSANLINEVETEFTGPINPVDMLSTLVANTTVVPKEYFNSVIAAMSEDIEVDKDENPDEWKEERKKIQVRFVDLVTNVSKTIKGVKGVEYAEANLEQLKSLLIDYGIAAVGMSPDEMSEILQKTMFNKIDPKNC